MLFRKFLLRIRKEHHADSKKLLLYSGAALLLITLIGVATDAFLPFTGGWNALRSIILAPTALAIFVFGYAISLQMHYKRIAEDNEWVPFRLRLSPMWRRRVAAVVAAIAFVFVYANGYRIGYTFVSSLFVAVLIALFAFIRTTREESKREEFNIPDARDTNYETRRRKLAEDRAEAIRQREADKKAKKISKSFRSSRED